ncbi:helix-turn-helix transcriptional regulator [Actinoplanes solisilvae]|uniref:helix-turn-helix transcriptional regulator n=1 Tax=Actinoplanes solisilvae TaxID=2486853 RepID=UPI000FDCB26E|nr:LuxR family transcriptional regulator [Actinoplanes solisilvae]
MGQPDPLVGRDDELARLNSFVDEVCDTGAALCLYGEPGIGKTALLDAAAWGAAARGLPVLRAHGSALETDLRHATLHELLWPAADRITSRDDEHGAALSGVLTGTPGDADVPAAILAVFGPATLVLVDDLQWADPASLAVLRELAAGRRLGVLGASRCETTMAGASALLHVGPLDAEAAAALVDRTTGPVSRWRERILSVARGNPFLLTELRDAQWDGADVLPDRVRDSYAAELAAVPVAARDDLLLAALNDGEDIDLPDAGARLGQARHLGIVVGGTTLRFRTSLLRAAVIADAAAEEQARAHRTLARIFQDDPRRSAWHLAEASFRPDDEVAALLERKARESLHAGHIAAAVDTLRRAAELSLASTERGRRLAEAAYLAASVRGDLATARELLEAARARPGSLPAATAAAQLLINGGGDLDTAHRTLCAAVEPAEYDATNPDLIEALSELVDVCSDGRRDELWEPLDAALARLRPAPPPLLTLHAHAQRGPAHVTKTDLDLLIELIEGIETETDPVRIDRIITSALVLDRGPECRPALWRVIEDGRAGGAVRTAVIALFTVAADAYALGDWDQAAAFGDEAVRTAEAHDLGHLARLAAMAPLLVEAARGGEVLEATREIATWAAPRGLDGLVQWCHQVRASAAMARGDFENAYQQGTAILSRAAFPLWAGFDLVESALRTDRAADAVAYVRALDAARLDRVSDRLRLMTAGTAAMVADDATAPALFARALALPGADRYRFEAARLRLLLGERLRRTRRTAQAKTQLGLAVAEFGRLGATPWTERATRELTSASGRRTSTPDPGSLTSQERAVAELAAAGLTTPMIADRLQLSRSTVASHLRHVFHKLGITSRSALRDVLD